MSGNKAPPPPDYSGIAAAQQRAAELAAETSAAQLEWAKEQYAKDYALTSQVVNSQIESQNRLLDWADEDRAFYNKVFRPLEERYAQDAATWDSPERMRSEAGKAAGMVTRQYDQAREAAARNLEGYGVDPTSTRYAALDIGARTAGAAAAAAAGNQAITNTRREGIAMRKSAVDIGRGYAGQNTAQVAGAGTAGNSAVGNTLGTTASGASTMGTALGWAGQQGNNLTGWGNTLNTGYNNTLAWNKANQSNSSGIGKLIGAGVGLASNFLLPGSGAITGPLTSSLFGGGSYATDGIGGYGPTAPMQFAEGGAVPAEGAVPMGASPSRGAVTDDIPVTMDDGGEARINAGEFIIPRDVTAWLGEKQMYALLDKARKEKQTMTQALPVGGQPQRPPAAQALPVG